MNDYKEKYIIHKEGMDNLKKVFDIINIINKR